MTAPTLQFHLLDTVSRDIRIEEEDKPPYESPPSEEDESGRKRYNANEKREMVMYLYGSTSTGQPIQVDVVGFRPTLYLALPSTKTLQAIDAIRTYLTVQGVPLSQLTLKQVQRKKFYGFTANQFFPFLEITVPSLALFRLIKNLFLNDKSEPSTRKPLGSPFRRTDIVEVYEANLDPMLRFFHVQNLNPCGWVSIDTDSVEDLTAPVWQATVHCTDVHPVSVAAVAPFKLVSWDIECYSQTGAFPVAKKGWETVTATLLERKGKEETFAEAVNRLFETGIMGQLRPKKTIADLLTKLKGAPFQKTDVDDAGHLLSSLKDILSIGDPAIQIGATLTSNTSDADLQRHLFVWPSCDPLDSIVVHTYEDEKGMIVGFFEWLTTINPDILIGYNVFGFDERYVWDRAEDLGCTGALQMLSRVEDQEVKCDEKRLSSSAMGDNFMHIWTASGRLQIDLFHYIKRNESLPSYKLDEVTKHYLSGKLKKTEKNETGHLVLTLSGAIKDLRPGRALCLLEATGESLTDKMPILEVVGSVVTVEWPLTETGELLEEEQLADAVKWVVVKDDVSPADIFRLHKGTAADRAIVGKYCLQDCDLVLELYRNREVFNNSMSMANVCCVPVGYIFTRGQGIKAESLVFKACRANETLIPVLPAPNREGVEDSYEGAIVLDPIPGFYNKNPIGVADFASLYPSSMESENISHDSLVWVKDYDASGNLMEVVFGSDEFDERNGYGYTDIEFDLLRFDPEDKRKHKDKIKAGLRICRYAQPLDGSKATVPEIIKGLLAKRKAKRKEKAKEPDPAKQALLEAEQLAYKLTANSLYGQLGSSTFKVRLQHLAASITAYGRKQILFAKEVIEQFYGLDAFHPKCIASVMYGDTDSLFVEFALKDSSLSPRLRRQAVIDLTTEAGHLVTKALAPPHDFEFDKIFDPMLMFSKKRYAGLMFEENADDFVVKYMGIALKRRDNAPIVKTIYGSAMKKLLFERDVVGATKLVQDSCMDLVNGKVKLGQLTITKSLRAEYANPLQIAHKALADRMALRDPGNAPASGDRIPFVYVRPAVGAVAAKLQGDRIEAPSWIKEKGLVPDYEFYLGHQLQNPISQMFGLLLEEMPGSDTVPWSKMPTDNEEKRLIWRESSAADLLFGKAFQLCGKQHTSAFVTKFFGLNGGFSHNASASSDSLKLSTLSTGKEMQKTQPIKKTVQATLSNFMMDQFLVKTIEKKQNKKRKDAKAASLKNEVVTE
uniref:DNA-directed DNA polymerase n=1 Tax=viral metagenome TaxID=1070528 RepID=A0A6C0K559_9ZZZZ